MRYPFSAGRADAITARPGAETSSASATATPLTLTRCTHTSSCSGSLAPGACSVSSRHDAYLLFLFICSVLDALMITDISLLQQRLGKILVDRGLVESFPDLYILLLTQVLFIGFVWQIMFTTVPFLEGRGKK